MPRHDNPDKAITRLLAEAGASLDPELAPLAAQRDRLNERIRAGKVARSKRKALEAELMAMMGDAKKAIGPGGVQLQIINVKRGASSYRYLRIKKANPGGIPPPRKER